MDRPPHVPEQFEIKTVDINSEQLENLTREPVLKDIIAFLVKDRGPEEKIGSVDIYTDDDGKLHLDFATSFSCEKSNTEN